MKTAARHLFIRRRAARGVELGMRLENLPWGRDISKER